MIEVTATGGYPHDFTTTVLDPLVGVTFGTATGRGVPPFFTTELEPLARGTLHLTDETTIIHDVLGAAWRTIAIADSCLEIKLAPNTSSRPQKEQGVCHSRASDSGPPKKKRFPYKGTPLS